MIQLNQFIEQEKFRRLKEIKIISFNSAIHGQNNKKQTSINITPISRSLQSLHKPFTYNCKSQSLDKKLALFFQKKGRPRPQVLVPRTIEIKSKHSITLPKIKTQFQQRANNQYYINGNRCSIGFKNHSKTIPIQQYQPILEQKKVKRLSKKQQRKLHISWSKKLNLNQIIMTKHGWINETKEQCIIDFSRKKL